MLRISEVVSAVFLCSVASAKAAAQSTHAKEPTLAETISWLTTDATPMLTYTEGPKLGRPGISRRWIHDLRVNDCRMSWGDSHAINVSPSSGKAEKLNTATYSAPLGDLDVAGMRVKTIANDNAIIEFAPRKSKPGFPFNLTAPIQRSDTTRIVGLAVRNADDGKRVVAALKRAATLCGAPAAPF